MTLAYCVEYPCLSLQASSLQTPKVPPLTLVHKTGLRSKAAFYALVNTFSTFSVWTMDNARRFFPFHPRSDCKRQPKKLRWRVVHDIRNVYGHFSGMFGRVIHFGGALASLLPSSSSGGGLPLFIELFLFPPPLSLVCAFFPCPNSYPPLSPPPLWRCP